MLSLVASLSLASLLLPSATRWPASQLSRLSPLGVAPARCISPLLMAKAAKKKATKKKTASSGGGGFGAAAVVAAEKKEEPKDLLRKSTEAYDDLKKEGNANAETDDSIISYLEYTLAIRVQGEGAGDAADSFGDWVPVAIAIVKCASEQDAAALVPGVVGSRCREILEAACTAYPALRKSARNCVEYSFENIDSWTTHVQNGLSGRKERRQAALKVLGVEAGASAKEIKMAHRTLMLELHPDMFVDDEEGAKEADERMLAVQDAYAQLGGGQGDATGSAYAAIGGKGRVDFSGQLSREQLGALGKKRTAEEMSLELGGWRAGVAAIMEDLTQEFIARNLEDARARRAMQV